MEKKLTLTQRVLVRAAELISKKEKWIKGNSFRRPVSEPLGDPFDRYCAVGAVNKAAAIETGARNPNQLDQEGREACSAAWNILQGKSPRFNLIGYNDDHRTTHEDIKKVFCDAVKSEIGDDDGS